jgi:hypothetical protein
MKKYAVVFALAISFPAYADQARLEKENGIIEITKTVHGFEFFLNSSVEQSACNIEGTAEPIDDHRAAFTPDDKDDPCVVLFNFQSENEVTVTTKSCEKKCGFSAIGSMDGTYQLPQDKKIETSEVDYDEAVNAMNAPYLAYGNGAYAMFNAEKECWDTISNATDAERCMAMLIAGSFIEAAWAQKQGRVPVPNYQGDAVTKRMDENLAKAKISEEEKQMARNNLKKNGNRIIPSMINVGALGR